MSRLTVKAHAGCWARAWAFFRCSNAINEASPSTCAGPQVQPWRAAHPRLIHVSHKGFLPGPNDHRTALDEGVQRMGGLAHITGQGMPVQAALFDNAVCLMGQHMLQFAMTGRYPAPMPARDNPWAVYEVFTVAGGEQIFLAAVSDAPWATMCKALGFADLLASRSAAELLTIFEANGLPFAPIRKPGVLYDNPHLQATGGPADLRLPDGDKAGQTVKTMLFPFTLDDQRLGVRLNPPTLGERTAALLAGLG